MRQRILVMLDRAGCACRAAVVYWQSAWHASQGRRWWEDYRAAWCRRPMGHAGVVWLVALIVYLLARRGHPVTGESWMVFVFLAVVGLVGLCDRRDWSAVQQTSVICRWWGRHWAQRALVTPSADIEAVKAHVRSRYDQYARAESAQLAAPHHNPDELFPLERLAPARRYFVLRKIRTALRLGQLPPGARILEVGCARGLYTFALARLGFQMTGVDASPDSIAVARQKAQQLGDTRTTFLVDDAETLANVPSHAFDAVLSFSVLRYVPRLDQALRSCARVVRPGGVALLDFPNRWCPWFYWLKPFTRVERHPEDRYFSAGDVRRRIGAAGFEDIAIRHLLFTPGTAPTGWLPMFRMIDVVGESLPPLNRLAAIILCVARRSA